MNAQQRPEGEGHVRIEVKRANSQGTVYVDGNLILPHGAKGVVLFAHGSGSGRFSSRNQRVAERLRKSGQIGTLLIDLLTQEEEQVDERTRHHRFDIAMLTQRVTDVVDWLQKNPATRELRIGLFGASTGAAAAIGAAALRKHAVKAVVSRGGRPDISPPRALQTIEAPTMIIVGGHDYGVIELNQQAFNELQRCDKQFEVIPGATHLFEERGAIEKVCELAEFWFKKNLVEGAMPSDEPASTATSSEGGKVHQVSEKHHPTDQAAVPDTQ